MSSNHDLQDVRNKSLRLLYQQLRLQVYFERHFSSSSDERLTLKTSAFKLFTMANLRYQFSS